MENVRIRLIYSPNLAREHVEAAYAGLEPFKRFNALVEAACANESGAFKGVKHSRLLRRIALAKDDIFLDSVMTGRPDDKRSVLGIAVTPHQMMLSAGSQEATCGLGGYMSGAMVSICWPLQLENPNPVIAAMVKYQAGNLLFPREKGTTPACLNPCVMQENPDFLDFAQRALECGLDLCEDCAATIKSTIMRLSKGLN